MKTMIKSTMKCVAIALCVLLAACTTDVYEPEPDPVPPTPENQIHLCLMISISLPPLFTK